jgi:hypothetical protein
MSDSFEEYAVARIALLRSEADALENALSEYRRKQGRQGHQPFAPSGNVTPLRKPKTAPRRARKGTKRGLVLARIGESIGGLTTGEVWEAVHRVYGDMKRSSLRAMLYMEAKSGNLERRGDRYVLKQDRPNAPTFGLSN